MANFQFTDAQWRAYQAIPQGYSHRHWIEKTVNSWLAEHDRKEREMAWYEGLEAAVNADLGDYEVAPSVPRSPYTKHEPVEDHKAMQALKDIEFLWDWRVNKGQRFLEHGADVAVMRLILDGTPIQKIPGFEWVERDQEKEVSDGKPKGA